MLVVPLCVLMCVLLMSLFYRKASCSVLGGYVVICLCFAWLCVFVVLCCCVSVCSCVCGLHGCLSVVVVLCVCLSFSDDGLFLLFIRLFVYASVCLLFLFVVEMFAHVVMCWGVCC